MAESFSTDFKRFFGKGLAILLPTVVTLWILWQAIGFVYTNVAQPINRATRLSVLWIVPQVFEEESLPDWFSVTDEELLTYRATREVSGNVNDGSLRRQIRREYLRKFWDDHWYLSLTGFFVAILLIYLAGVLISNFFGRQIYVRIERLIAQIPGFKQVYPHVKQLVDMILGEKKLAFSKVVLVEYPSAGIWTMGFLTGDSLRFIDGPAGGRVVSVFIPTSPTPFTGFTINVLEEKAIEVDVSIEEALRFVITAGVLTPDQGETPTLFEGPEGPRVVAAESSEEAAARAKAHINPASTPPATDEGGSEATRKGA
ncbi:MAG: DUF502 domain-containing protein [Phycisphaerales bacterium]